MIGEIFYFILLEGSLFYVFFSIISLDRFRGFFAGRGFVCGFLESFIKEDVIGFDLER